MCATLHDLVSHRPLLAFKRPPVRTPRPCARRPRPGADVVVPERQRGSAPRFVGAVRCRCLQRRTCGQRWWLKICFDDVRLHTQVGHPWWRPIGGYRAAPRRVHAPSARRARPCPCPQRRETVGRARRTAASRVAIRGTALMISSAIGSSGKVWARPFLQRSRRHGPGAGLEIDLATGAFRRSPARRQASRMRSLVMRPKSSSPQARQIAASSSSVSTRSRGLEACGLRCRSWGWPLDDAHRHRPGEEAGQRCASPAAGLSCRARDRSRPVGWRYLSVSRRRPACHATVGNRA